MGMLASKAQAVRALGVCAAVHDVARHSGGRIRAQTDDDVCHLL
jgi:hypothetical protein